MNFLKVMIINYPSILTLNSDIYLMTMPQNDSLDGIKLSAFRLHNLFDSHGYVAVFITELN
jgi:hypothetical protein